MKRVLICPLVGLGLLVSGCNYSKPNLPEWCKKIFTKEKKYSEVSSTKYGCIYIPANTSDTVTQAKAIGEIERKLIEWEDEFSSNKIFSATLDYGDYNNSGSNIRGEQFCFIIEK
jgi:hypothetical protein